MIGAEQIREAAREVLGRPEYADLEPSLAEEWFGWLRTQLAELLDAVLGSSAAGGIGRVIAFAVVGLLVVAAVVLLLGVRRSGDVDAVVDVDVGRDAMTLLAVADEARATGDLELAIRSRYGALVLVLVEAGVLAGRPGLTVGEVDDAAAAGVPTAVSPVAAAGRVLADVVYGDGTPDGEGDDAVAAAVAAVARATGRRDVERVTDAAVPA